MSKALLRAALGLASKGFYVHPLNDRAKTPRLKRWQARATCDRSVIRGWWDQWPNANIGIAVGRSGHFVIDVDVKEGKGGLATMAYFARTLGRLPSTLTSRTPSGGYHMYFEQPFLIANATNSWPGEDRYAEHPPGWPSMNGVDLRGGHGTSGHGYVVAPPSVLEEGSYVWHRKVAPSKMRGVEDAGWMDLLYKRDRPPPVELPPVEPNEKPADRRVAAYVDAAVKTQLKRVADVGKGARTDTLRDVSMSLACFPQIRQDWLIRTMLEAALSIGYDKAYPKDWRGTVERQVRGAYSRRKDMIDVDRILADKDRRGKR